MKSLHCFLILAAGSLSASESNAMLKVPPSARSAALAGAFSMVGGSGEAMWFNPSAAAGLEGLDLGLSHLAWIGESTDDVLYAALGGKGLALGVLAQIASAQDVYRDSAGTQGPAFNDSSQAEGLDFAAQIGAIRLGLGAKSLGLKAAGKSQGGWSLDCGAILSLWKDRLALSLAYLNAGSLSQLGALNSPAAPPANLRAGLGLMNLSGWNLLGEYRAWTESGQSSLAFGLEYLQPAGPAVLAVRSGYESGLAEGGLAGLCLGLGMEWSGLSLDYAYQMMGDFGSGQRLSLQWKVRRSPPPAPKKIKAINSKTPAR
jgi:hypothetical protein